MAFNSRPSASNFRSFSRSKEQFILTEDQNNFGNKISFLFRYYSQESLVGDPDFGPILSSLLVGPCALEYTKVKSNNHWYELPANELVQR